MDSFEKKANRKLGKYCWFCVCACIAKFAAVLSQNSNRSQ